MAPPRWQVGWTDGQNPPPPAPPSFTLNNGASPVLARIGGVGPWVTSTFGVVGPGDTVLVYQAAPPRWVPGALPAAGFIVARP